MADGEARTKLVTPSEWALRHGVTHPDGRTGIDEGQVWTWLQNRVPLTVNAPLAKAEWAWDWYWRQLAEHGEWNPRPEKQRSRAGVTYVGYLVQNTGWLVVMHLRLMPAPTNEASVWQMVIAVVPPGGWEVD